MNRRELLTGSVPPASLFWPLLIRLGAREASAAKRPARPTPEQLEWQDLELGVLFHFDLPVFAPGGWTALKGTLDPNLYQPAKLDTDQWLEAAKAVGARYAIFTVTHFNGFLQWQSDLYPYGLKQTSWRGGKADVFGDFVESCRKYGIAPGVYLSTHRNAYWRVWSHKVNWGQGGPEQARFARMCERMVGELCSRYGKLVEIWFDAGVLTPEEGGPDVLPIVDRLQPGIIFYHSDQRRDHRWCGHSDRGGVDDPCWATITDPDRGNVEDFLGMIRSGDPSGTYWSPAFSGLPLRGHWFWRSQTPKDKAHPIDRLVESYYNTVGRNANLVIGAAPNTEGLISDADFQRCAEFGRVIRKRFDRPLADAAGEGETVKLKLPQPTRIDHVVIMEDIAEGERVRAYQVEGRGNAGNWRMLCAGQLIGHRRIQRLQPVEIAAIRFRATASTATPIIRKLAVYFTGGV